jgi:5-formyltetrahydrofolate cyclo-ligase
MEQRQLVSELDFKLSRFGTHEPGSGPAVPPSAIDLVVAPALAADRRGFRVGYGGGYYDRFLVKTRCPRAVAVYSACLLDRIVEDTHDIQMDYVVTEAETITTG